MFAWSQESQLSEILGPNSLLNANTDIDQEYLAYTFFSDTKHLVHFNQNDVLNIRLAKVF